MKKIKWKWFSAAIILILYGCYALYAGWVYLYAIHGKHNIISKTSANYEFWFYSLSYIHMGVGSLFFSWKDYYPIKLQQLMSFTRESSLSKGQFFFISSFFLLLMISSFYLAGIFSHKGYFNGILESATLK